MPSDAQIEHAPADTEQQFKSKLTLTPNPERQIGRRKHKAERQRILEECPVTDALIIGNNWRSDNVWKVCSVQQCVDRPGQDEIYATSPIRPGSPYLVETFGPEFRPRPCHYCRGALGQLCVTGSTGYLHANETNRRKSIPRKKPSAVRVEHLKNHQ